MKIEIKNKTLVIAVFAAFLALLGVGIYIGVSHERKAAKLTENALKAELRLYSGIIADKQQTISQKEQVITKQRDALRKLGMDNGDLKALNIRLTRDLTEANLKIDTLLQNVQNNGHVITVHDTITQAPKNAILLPFQFGDKTRPYDKWLTLWGNFNNKGILDSVLIRMDMPVDVITGYEKKTNKPIITITTPNSYIKTVSINSYKTENPPKPKWGIGLQGGYGIVTSNKVGNGPYVGIGVTRLIFRF